MERKKYHWPNPQELNGSGSITQPAKVMLQCLYNLGNILQDIQETLEATQKGKHLQVDLKALWASCGSREVFLDRVAWLIKEQGLTEEQYHDLQSTMRREGVVFEDTSHPDYKGNLGESEERSRIEKVRVYEYQRFRDGGTIEYRDRHNRRYFVPAPAYKNDGVYHSGFSWINENRLVDIELEIVPGTESL